MPGEIREEAQGSYIPGTELKKIPPMILLPVELGEQEQVLEESFLRLGYSAKVLTPKRGASADLLKMAEKMPWTLSTSRAASLVISIRPWASCNRV
jgi:hypothetical protein